MVPAEILKNQKNLVNQLKRNQLNFEAIRKAKFFTLSMLKVRISFTAESNFV